MSKEDLIEEELQLDQNANILSVGDVFVKSHEQIDVLGGYIIELLKQKEIKDYLFERKTQKINKTFYG